MVYCTKCGTKNPEDARVCTKCGAQLYPVVDERERYRRSARESECFGIPHGGAIIVIAIGVIIVLSGLFMFLRQQNIIPQNMDVGPFALIIFGILILIGAAYAMRRRY